MGLFDSIDTSKLPHIDTSRLPRIDISKLPRVDTSKLPSASQLEDFARVAVGRAGELGGIALQNAQSGLSALRTSMTNGTGPGAAGSDTAHARDVEQPKETVAGQIQEELAMFTEMSWGQRIGAFAFCFACGAALIFLSFMFLPYIILKPAKFALSFTLGNVLALLSTCFLVGPAAQLRSMFHPARAVAAVLYLGSLVGTLLAAFLGGKLRYLLVMIMIVIEICSLIWYCLSYIPYGRELISKALDIQW